ncbi:prostaglandin-H2 D-isomerase-like [Pogona vitticeps]
MNLGGLTNPNSHPQTVEILEDGDLVVHIEMPEENCQKKWVWLSQGNQPGVFTTKHSTVYIAETDYDTYAILYAETPHQKVLHLNAREPEASDEARGRFNHLATTLGLPIDRTIYLTKVGSCPQ